MGLFNNLAATQIETFEEDKKLSYGVFSNGLWRRDKTPLGQFTHKIQDLPLNMGLTKPCEFSFTRDDSIPKIPISIYNEILKYYKHIYQTVKSEVYTCIVWDKVKQDFFIHVPKQKVSGAQVDFENEPEVMSNPNLNVYMDIHSHANFGAFYSAGDIKDEVSARYFGVIGNVLSEQESKVFKVAINRQYQDLVLEDIFDMKTTKLHADSNYTLDYSVVDLKITERAKAIASKVPLSATVYSKPYSKVSPAVQSKTYTSVQDYLDRNKKPKNTHKWYNNYVHDYKDDYEDDYEDNYGDSWGALMSLDNDGYYDSLEDEIEPSVLNLIDPLKSAENFLYDFEQVFGGKQDPQSIANLYESLTNLINESGYYIPELTIEKVILSILTANSSSKP